MKYGDSIDPLASLKEIKNCILQRLRCEIDNCQVELRELLDGMIKALEASAVDQFVASLLPLKQLMDRLAVTRCSLLCGRLIEWHRSINAYHARSMNMLGHLIDAYACFIQLFAEYLLFLEHETLKMNGRRVSDSNMSFSVFLEFAKIIPSSHLFDIVH